MRIQLKYSWQRCMSSQQCIWQTNWSQRQLLKCHCYIIETRRFSSAIDFHMRVHSIEAHVKFCQAGNQIGIKPPHGAFFGHWSCWKANKNLVAWVAQAAVTKGCKSLYHEARLLFTEKILDGTLLQYYYYHKKFKAYFLGPIGSKIWSMVQTATLGCLTSSLLNS